MKKAIALLLIGILAALFFSGCYVYTNHPPQQPSGNSLPTEHPGGQGPGRSTPW